MNIHLPSCSTRRVAVSLALTLGAFAAGWVSANIPFATSVNTGLVRALNSVGQDLFGAAVFSARTIPNDPVFPNDPIRVQLDFAYDSQIPTAVNLFLPPNPIQPVDPCRVAAQLRLNGDGTATVALDTSVTGINFDTSADLSAVVLSNARCATVCDPNSDVCY